MKTLGVCIILAGLLSACGGDAPTSVASQVALAQHEALWAHRGFHSYGFDIVQQQFGGTSNLHVTVRADTIASIIDNDTGLPPQLGQTSPSMDLLFAIAAGAVTNKHLKVDLAFDDQIGYLTLYAVESRIATPGGPYSVRVSNLVPLE